MNFCICNAQVDFPDLVLYKCMVVACSCALAHAPKALEFVDECTKSAGKRSMSEDKCTENTEQGGNFVHECTQSTVKCGIFVDECTESTEQNGIFANECTETRYFL